jgi:MFS family permease
MMDRWGRRKICFVADIGLFLGASLVCAAQTVSMIVVGKTIEGFFRSMIGTALTVSMRLCTVAETSLREKQGLVRLRKIQNLVRHQEELVD